MSDLSVTSDIAISGMKAQSERLRIISENMANAESVGIREGEDPYRRQVVTFKNYIDKKTGAEMVKVDKVIQDQSPFIKKYAPNHPAADALAKRGHCQFGAKLKDAHADDEQHGPDQKQQQGPSFHRDDRRAQQKDDDGDRQNAGQGFLGFLF